MAVSHQQDTVDKMITRYFVTVTKEAFTYKKKVYDPKPLLISSSLIRDYTCPSGCGGCCKAYSLDFLPNETLPYEMPQREIEFNGKIFKVFSDTQEDRIGEYCKNLDLSNGRCMIHRDHALGCDFELIRMFIGKEENRIRTSLFGRGWNMMRVDGGKGAMCEIIPATEETLQNIIRKFKRLKEWTDFFGINTHIPTIIRWCANKDYETPLRLNVVNRRTFFEENDND